MDGESRNETVANWKHKLSSCSEAQYESPAAGQSGYLTEWMTWLR
jgi:hypothetical protein